MEDLDFLENASASFTDIEQSGSPIMPIAFDQPQVGRAVRVDAPVYNPHTQDVLVVRNIVYEHHMDGRPPERAYWVGRKLKKMHLRGSEGMHNIAVSKRSRNTLGSNRAQGSCKNHVVGKNKGPSAH